MNTKVIFSPDHPLASQLNGLHYSQSFDFSQLDQVDLIFDLTILPHAEKLQWLDKICASSKVISDTSCNWGEYMNKRYTQLIGCLGLAFYSPQSKVECFLNDPNFKPQVEEILNSLGLAAHWVSQAGHGFTYPRTISTLINEAYFALEDELATKEDMDLAMQYGVNYPHGLFEWSKKIGILPVLRLLESLYQETGDPRYRQAPLLKIAGAQLNL
jgi:3-hydroxybutyryl-CoA dehydrogenase